MGAGITDDLTQLSIIAILTGTDDSVVDVMTCTTMQAGVRQTVMGVQVEGHLTQRTWNVQSGSGRGLAYFALLTIF